MKNHFNGATRIFPIRSGSQSSKNPKLVAVRRISRKSMAFVSVFLVAMVSAHAVTHVWTGNGFGNYWSEPANWQDGKLPQSGESSNVLVFPAGSARLVSTNDFSGLVLDQLVLSGSGYGLAGANGLLLSSNGPVSIQALGQTNWIALPLAFQGTNIFQVASNAALSLAGNLSGPGGFLLSGGGLLELAPAKGHDNTYVGPSLVLNGILQLHSGFTTEPVSGNRIYALAVPGALTVGQTGGTNMAILQGMAMSTNTALTLLGSGQYQVAGDFLGFGSLAGDGLVNLVEQGFQVGPDNASTVFSGTFTNQFEAGVYKVGDGALTLSGRSVGNVPLGVLDGILYVDGDFSTSTVQNTAALEGNGQIGFFVVNGLVSPGHGGPGRLTGNMIAFDLNSLLLAKLGGTNAGTNYDQLVARQSFGFVDPSAALQVELLPGFVGSVGNQYTIVRNDGTGPIFGNFNGLPEGATFKLAEGAVFRISYQGGDGNDIVLTQLTAVPILKVPVMIGNTQLLISGTGSPGTNYAIEANTNLFSPAGWLPIGSVQTGADGSFGFTDLLANLPAARIYRVHGL